MDRDRYRERGWEYIDRYIYRGREVNRQLDGLFLVYLDKRLIDRQMDRDRERKGMGRKMD